MNVSGNPFLARNRHKASIDVSVDMFGVSSKCTHLVVVHVNNNIHDLFIPGTSVLTSLTKRKPA